MSYEGRSFERVNIKIIIQKRSFSRAILLVRDNTCIHFEYTVKLFLRKIQY